MTILYRNAFLTAIAPRGATEDYDVAATAGINRWTGSVGIYVDDSRGQITAPGRIDDVEQTRLEIPYQVAGAAVGKLVALGDTLTYQDEDGTHQRVAARVVKAPLTNRTQVLLRDA